MITLQKEVNFGPQSENIGKMLYVKCVLFHKCCSVTDQLRFTHVTGHIDVGDKLMSVTLSW